MGEPAPRGAVTRHRDAQQRTAAGGWSGGWFDGARMGVTPPPTLSNTARLRVMSLVCNAAVVEYDDDDGERALLVYGGEEDDGRRVDGRSAGAPLCWSATLRRQTGTDAFTSCVLNTPHPSHTPVALSHAKGVRCAASFSSRFVFFGGVDKNGLLCNNIGVASLYTSRSAKKLIWQNLAPGNGAPSPRAYMSFDVEPTTGKMFVFGGFTRPGGGLRHALDAFDNNVYCLEPPADGANLAADAPVPSPLTWSTVQTSGPKPRARGGHFSAVIEGRLLVAGGAADHTGLALNMDIFALGLSGNNAWTKLTITGPAPPSHCGQACTKFRGGILVFGGSSLDDGDKFSCHADFHFAAIDFARSPKAEWSAVHVENGPVAQHGATLAVVGDDVIVFFGSRVNPDFKSSYVAASPNQPWKGTLRQGRPPSPAAA